MVKTIGGRQVGKRITALIYGLAYIQIHNIPTSYNDRLKFIKEHGFDETCEFLTTDLFIKGV